MREISSKHQAKIANKCTKTKSAMNKLPVQNLSVGQQIYVNLRAIGVLWRKCTVSLFRRLDYQMKTYQLMLYLLPVIVRLSVYVTCPLLNAVLLKKHDKVK